MEVPFSVANLAALTAAPITSIGYVGIFGREFMAVYTVCLARINGSRANTPLIIFFMRDWLDVVRINALTNAA